MLCPNEADHRRHRVLILRHLKGWQLMNRNKNSITLGEVSVCTES